MKTKIKNIEDKSLREKVINTHGVNAYKAAPTSEVLEMECYIYKFNVENEGEFEYVFIPENKYTIDGCVGIINNSNFVYKVEAEELRKEAIEIINK